MVRGPRRHHYVVDGEPRVAEPIHPRWYTPRGILELNERLRAPPVELRFKAMARELPPMARRRLTPEILGVTRALMEHLYVRTRPLLDAHLRNYPMPELDPDLFASPPGRRASEAYLAALRRGGRRWHPRPLPSREIAPPIVVFGTSRSAESLRMHALFGASIAWRQLENQRGNAQADYCLGITALGAETALGLLDYWWDGKDPGEDQHIQEAYDTLYHEPVHRICDLRNPFGPQYGPKGGAKEHYWMEEYEPFASQVERVLVRHLAEGRDRGVLRRRLQKAR
ncbi:MAG TPA: hypothetical protein VGR28_07475 [Candidatus Thermoplasmatota archaeon]|jgi:hypothetical protein|nr:hypothetical protein [Candidatus Thermoplasmatota archaeon]